MVAEFPSPVGFSQFLYFLLINHTYFLNNLLELVANERKLYFPFVGKLLELVLQFRECTDEKSSTFRFDLLILFHRLSKIIFKNLEILLILTHRVRQIHQHFVRHIQRTFVHFWNLFENWLFGSLVILGWFKHSMYSLRFNTDY